MMIEAPTASLPQVRAGTIKAYAVTADSRMAAATDIPTVAEAGLPGLYLSNWYALFAPKGTPKDIIDRLNAAVVDALADPAVRSRLADQGRSFQRASSKPRRCSWRSRAPISINGGPSSRPQTSEVSNLSRRMRRSVRRQFLHLTSGRLDARGEPMLSGERLQRSFANGWATVRAISIKSWASGLSVRFLDV